CSDTYRIKNEMLRGHLGQHMFANMPFASPRPGREADGRVHEDLRARTQADARARRRIRSSRWTLEDAGRNLDLAGQESLREGNGGRSPAAARTGGATPIGSSRRPSVRVYPKSQLEPDLGLFTSRNLQRARVAWALLRKTGKMVCACHNWKDVQATPRASATTSRLAG